MVKERFYDTKRLKLRDSVFNRESSAEWIHDLFFQTVYDISPKGARILDIGTGNGFVLREISNRFPSRNYILFGIDNSLDMVDVATKNLGIESQVIAGDNYAIPFVDGYFDTVTAKNVTRFSPEEAARVLKSNGYFTFREYGKGKGLRDVAELFPGRIIRSRETYFYVEALRNAGFADVELKEFEIVRDYATGHLMEILEMFPFIEGFSEKDKEKVLELEIDGSIEITSDPILITGRKI